MSANPTNPINATKEWLLSSGIQETSGRNTGGFNSWFDSDAKGYSYVYSEITGYGITSLLYIAGVFADAAVCIEKARLAAGWLMSKATHSCGGVKTRDYHTATGESHLYSFDSENLYAFDNGMALYGIINLYKKTGEKKYLEYAVRIADFMMDKFTAPGGLFYAVYNPRTGEKTDSSLKWSTQSGSFHAKLALGFIGLYDVTKDEKYKLAAYNLCRKSLDSQEASGRFITSRADRSTHLHPHSYSAEGLLYAGVYLNERDFVVSAERAVRWALDNSLADGGIPKKYDGGNFIPLYRSDVLAQILRLGVILRSMDVLEKKYDLLLDALRRRLLDFQYSSSDRHGGGFCYGFTLDGVRRRHINSWCSMFALQALIMYDEFYVKRNKIDTLRCFI